MCNPQARHIYLPISTFVLAYCKFDIFINRVSGLFFRDEENKIVEELFLKLKKPKEEKPEQFKAHEIPIESQIPLFDKIMADQEKRSDQVYV